MNRYYVVADAEMPAPGTTLGDWHSIDLGSHGAAGAGQHVVVLRDDTVQPPSAWTPMPKLVDPVTTIADAGVAAYVADVGVASADTMYLASQALGAIHPLMAH